MDEMTTAELNQYLETIAKLIESNAADATAAAQIVRDSKGEGIRKGAVTRQAHRSNTPA